MQTSDALAQPLRFLQADIAKIFFQALFEILL